MEHEVHHSHSPLLHPYRSRVCARPTGSSASVLSTPPRRPDPPLCRWRARGFPLPTSTTVAAGPAPRRPELLCAIGAMASASSAPPAADGLRLLTSLSLVVDKGRSSCISTQNQCTPFPVLHLDVDLVQKLRRNESNIGISGRSRCRSEFWGSFAQIYAQKLEGDERNQGSISD